MQTVLKHWLSVFPKVLLFLIFLTVPLGAQEGEKPVPEDDLAFWLSKERSRPAAAAQLVAAQNPLTAAILRAKGFQNVVWDELGFGDDKAPELDPRLLVNIRDRRPMPVLVGIPKNEIPPEDMAYYRLFSEAMVKSNDTPADVFVKSAEDNKNVTFSHLMTNPTKHRGQVVRIKGTMLMLRQEEPTLLAKKMGVKDLYQGWVYGPTRHTNPFCIYFTTLPEGLQPSEDMRKEVVFYGYFLNLYRYESKEGLKITPLLVGPTVVVEKKLETASDPVTPFSLMVLGLVLGGLVFMTVIFFLLNFWFRRTDQQLRSTVASIKEKYNPPQFVNEGDRPAVSDATKNGEPPISRLPESKTVDPERN